MNDSTLRVLGYVLGAFQILLAFVYFDSRNWNQVVIAILLFVGGVIALTVDMSSTFAKGARSALCFFAILLSAALVIKVLFLD